MDASTTAGVREIGSAEELGRVEDAWAALESSLPSPAQSVPWLQAAAAAFPDQPLRIVTLDDGGLAAAAPLVAMRGARETAGVRYLGEPVDLLWRDGESLDELTAVLAERRLPLVLPRVPVDSPTIPALRRAYGRVGGLVLERDTGATPILELEPGTEPEALLTARLRSDLRRADRHARELGSVEAEVRFPEPAALDELLAEALAVEAHSWKGRGGTALADDSLRLPFYRRYAAAAAARGMLLIAFLRIDGRAVAMHLDVVHAGSVWLLKIGYDDGYARCSPGQLLLLEVARHCAQAGCHSVEFLGSSAPWTRRWTALERPTHAVGCFPRRPSSLPPLAEQLAREAKARYRRRSRR